MKRLGKYAFDFLVQAVKDSVGETLDGRKKKRKDFVPCALTAWGELQSFKHFSQEYKIHGCLHLGHIRLAEDGRLVPIDFEHGANYPRRLKYQDEAHIFQSLLQNFPDTQVAERFLELWLQSV